jgi:hypothetical protein
MTATTPIQIAFMRSIDPAEPAARLIQAGLHAQVDARRATVAVAVDPGQGEETFARVEHTLDGWLADERLPFTLERTSTTTVVVRPPAD